MFSAVYTAKSDFDLTYILSKYLNFTLTTDEAGKFIPEILSHYGSGKNVSIMASMRPFGSKLETTVDGRLLPFASIPSTNPTLHGVGMIAADPEPHITKHWYVSRYNYYHLD